LSWRQRLPYKDAWVKRQEGATYQRYRLDLEVCPPALRDELMSYLTWCEAPVARNRHRRVAKRPVSGKQHLGAMLRLAGFATSVLQQPVESLTLRGLCQPDLIEAFSNWWLQERRGKMTAGLEQYLVIPKTIAKHWLKDEGLADTLTVMWHSLPAIEAVRDKDSRWLSLTRLEEVGLSLYPLNARRLQEYPILRQPHHLRHSSGATRAFHVAFSLVIRLLIRLPMRQRCIREMQLGRNLFQDNAGVWQIRFVGTELKVAMRRGQVNRYEFPFPADLVGLLEEWLNDWRPRVTTERSKEYVFINSRGNPFAMARHISDMMARTTYRFTGIGVTPHLIRDIWATEYLRRYRGDIAGAARRLGNTEAMVLAHYSHIIKEDVDERAEAFLQGTFAPEKRAMSPTRLR
jgi:hypothetical protein